MRRAFYMLGVAIYGLTALLAVAFLALLIHDRLGPIMAALR